MRVVRGVGALLLLLVLLVGIPVGLWQFGALALPGGVEGLADLPRLLLRPDDGTVLLAVLTLVGWLAWGSFALAVLVDVPAHVRGLPAPRLPGLGLQQRAASALVGAVVALVVGGMAASPATAVTLDDGPRGGGAVVTGAAWADTAGSDGAGTDGTSADTGDRSAPVDDADDPGPVLVVTVQQGDSLWSLAETHLGDGLQWKVIGQANLGQPQPGGGALGPDWELQPGWQLQVPGAAGAEAADTGDAVQASLSDGAADADGEERADLLHVVEPGDTLSGIAQEHLGDADRWPELAEATEPTTQPDGDRLSDPDLIHPGWTVTVPGAGEPVGATAGGADGPGLDGSGLDRSGLDAPATDDAAEASEGSTPDEQPQPEEPAAGGADGSTGADGSWGALADAAEHGADGGGARADLDDAALLDDTADGSADDVPAVDVATPAGIGGLLAAATVTLLAARRRDAREERLPGERLAPPEPAEQRLEEQLRAVAAGTGSDAMDAALTDLRRRLAAAGRELPAVRAARLTGDDLELYLVSPADLPAPWTALDDRTVWGVAFADVDTETPARRLVEELGLDLLGGAGGPAPETAPAPPPLPGLVCVGTDDDEGLVLLDLEQLGGLTVVGAREEARAVLGAVAAELAVGRARDTVEVVLVGFGEEVPAAVPGGSVRHVPDVARLLVELEARAGDVDRVLRDAGVDSVADARSRGLAHDAWDSQVVLLGDPDDVARHAERLAELVRDLPRAGVSTVVAALDDGTAVPGLAEWQLRLGEPSPGEAAEAQPWAVLEPAGVVLRPQRLPLPEARRLAALHAAPATVRGPAWGRSLSVVRSVPDAATAAVPAPDPAAGVRPGGEPTEPAPPPRLPTAEDLHGGAAPVVQLLGRVQVHGAAGPSPASHTARATALVAYLASSDGPRTRTQVAEALSPARRLTEQTVHALASRTRRWLGEDAEGRPYLPRAVDSGAYRVHPEVTTDWARWQALLGDDVTTTPVPVLVAALELVDEPFAGVVERHYTWAEQLREDVLAGVVDVAHEAARRSLLAGEFDLARRAARAGMRVDPAAEVLWRDLLRAEHGAGRPAVVAQLLERLRAYADDLGVDLHPDTEQLLDELSAGSAKRGRRERARAIGL